MLPWSFSEEFAAEKYVAQLQHNMWVTRRPPGLTPHGRPRASTATQRPAGFRSGHVPISRFIL
jgi:hypothetical protein